MLEGILTGELVLPAGDTAEPFVDTDDIADIAVAALTNPEQHNNVFELTGPRALTFAQCIDELAQALLGRPLKYTPVPVDAYIETLRKQGAPDAMQQLLHKLFTVVFDGRNSQVMSGVEEVLGRPATDFRTYVQKSVTSGVSNTPQHKEST